MAAMQGTEKHSAFITDEFVLVKKHKHGHFCYTVLFTIIVSIVWPFFKPNQTNIAMSTIYTI